MRVTNSMVLSSTLSDLNRSLGRLQESQAELSTGKTIRRSSDDPTGTSSAMTIRSQLRRMEQQERARTDADGWLSTADTTILSGLDTLERVKELTVRAANIGSSTAATQSGIADEIGQLREQMLTLANTRYLDRPIFNGTASGDAYDGAGVYQGNDAAVVRDLAPNTTMQVNVTGPDVFGDPAAAEGDLFAVLERLETAIATGDVSAIEAEHAHIDEARERMSATLAQIGSRSVRLEQVSTAAAKEDIVLRENLSELEDADIAEALISVKARENAYTAALQAAGRTLPPSLLDYMR